MTYLKNALALSMSFVILLCACSSADTELDTIHPDEDLKDASLARTEFTEAQAGKLREALQIAASAINDTLFERILRAQSEVYEWDHGRLDRVDQQHHADPVSFFLSELRTRGLPGMDQFVARDGYTNDDVTGSTVPCSEDINFNVDNLDRSARTPTYVAGTIVHERMHSFCFKHRSNNVSKPYNICDFTYHAGHIAITIAQYRANGSTPITRPLKMCSSLLKRLQDENIIIK